jgi:peptide/nickel transport system permease protein
MNAVAGVGWRRARGGGALGLLLLAMLALPALAPHAPSEQFADRAYAPPMRVRVRDDRGAWRAPFVYPIRLADRLERRYEEDRRDPVRLRLFAGGRILGLEDERAGPLLLLGADSLGRDVLSRLLEGARLSLAVACVAAAGALLLGALAGGLAGLAGGLADEALMRVADFVVVLPAIYAVLALRAALPLVLDGPAVFALIASILALIGWPHVARGVRAIVAAEMRRDYVSAAVALGAGRSRVLFRHVLPAAYGFLAVQTTLLVPGFLIAEATLSYVGLGFAEPTATWGTMLREAADVRALAEYPWLLAPAAAIVLVVLLVNLATRASLADPGASARHGLA